MRDRTAVLLLIFLLAALPVLCSCGEDRGPTYFYSVVVTNETNGAITVRYHWDVLFLYYEWFGKVTIAPGGSEIIEWYSVNIVGEQIEAEYLGKKSSTPSGSSATCA